nr:immunoglobulin light chain junction region [Macaca mulatta]MOX23679.1 immunoglobulin light chain junction region [Macaca mulatta]MOX24559.1 immunoglobulin light chain junction region [Macaca mulatta]MOX24698.1 immunoglobulin light chain junction region [Macaca mulatta]MOX25850.1 immunoglobulin light chain junction region [Macaca mulatta]
CQQYNLAPFTF